MGVSRVEGTLGATIGPPADMLYAVEPEGVAIIRPSACNFAITTNFNTSRHAGQGGS